MASRGALDAIAMMEMCRSRGLRVHRIRDQRTWQILTVNFINEIKLLRLIVKSAHRGETGGRIETLRSRSGEIRGARGLALWDHGSL